MAYLMGMAKEIERKFLVKSDAWLARSEASITIVQCYLAVTAERSIRVRISNGDKARLTLKFGSDLNVRDEFEYDIPLDEAREMQAFALGKVITKTRHHVRHAGYLYEVDVFSGDLDGLVVAELETPDRVQDDALPDWLGPDITGEIRYSNASLALNGFPHEAP
jgi:CYTH domain-containing protein